MDDATLLERLARDCDRFAALLADADRTRPVATCPGWTIQRLADHLGRVHRSVTTMLSARDGDSHRAPPTAHAPGGPEAVAWFIEGCTSLSAALEAAIAPGHAEELIETWFGLQARRFWVRRMAHETAIHLFDLTNALGVEFSIDRRFALDGINELCDVFVVHRLSTEAAATLDGSSLHLHSTDQQGGDDAGEWMLRAVGGAIEVSHGHGKGDAALRGPASDLLLWGWGRKPSEDIETFGNSATVEAWATALSF